VTTGLVASSMLSAGVARVCEVPANVIGIVRLGYLLHFVTPGEQDTLAEGGHALLAGMPDSLRARIQRRSL